MTTDPWELEQQHHQVEPSSASMGSTYPMVLANRHNAIYPEYSQPMPPYNSSNLTHMNSINPNAKLSYISPQYRNSVATTMTRSQGWQPEKPENKPTEKKTSDEKEAAGLFSLACCGCANLTASHILCLLIGVIVCGVPMAVFATLLFKSSGTTTTVATDSTTLSTASTAVALPSQCLVYTNMMDSSRLVSSSGCCPSDTSISGWYRFSGAGGTKLVTTPLYTTGICSNSFPGWWNGTLPTTTGASSTGNVCFYTGSVCGYSLSPVSATNCGSYYVFYLVPPCCSSYRYCTTP